MFRCLYMLRHFACLHHCLWGTWTTVGSDTFRVGGGRNDCICHARNSGKDRLRIPFDKNILDARPLLWPWQIRSVFLSCFLPVGIKLLPKHLCSLLNLHVVDGQKQLLCIVLWLTHMCRGMCVHRYTCINKSNNSFNIWTKETRDNWSVLAHSHWPSRQGGYNYRHRKPPGVDAGGHQLQEQEASRCRRRKPPVTL